MKWVQLTFSTSGRHDYLWFSIAILPIMQCFKHLWNNNIVHKPTTIWGILLNNGSAMNTILSYFVKINAIGKRVPEITLQKLGWQWLFFQSFHICLQKKKIAKDQHKSTPQNLSLRAPVMHKDAEIWIWQINHKIKITNIVKHATRAKKRKMTKPMGIISTWEMHDTT